MRRRTRVSKLQTSVRRRRPPARQTSLQPCRFNCSMVMMRGVNESTGGELPDITRSGMISRGVVGSCEST